MEPISITQEVQSVVREFSQDPQYTAYARKIQGILTQGGDIIPALRDRVFNQLNTEELSRHPAVANSVSLFIQRHPEAGLSDANAMELLMDAYRNGNKPMLEACRKYLTWNSSLLSGIQEPKLSQYWQFASEAKLGWLKMLILNSHRPPLFEPLLRWVSGPSLSDRLSDLQRAMRQFPLSFNRSTGAITVRIQNLAEWEALTTSEIVPQLHITSLVLDHSRDLIIPLCHNLAHFDCLRNLELIGNHLTEEDVIALREALKVNRTLTQVHLEGCYLIGDLLKTLAPGLIENTTLQELYLSRNDLAEGGATLGEVLAANASLRKLHLAECNLGSQDAEELANGLRTNTTLREIHLEHNKLGAYGSRAFAEAWKANKKLTVIDLSNNEIGYKGAQPLAEALRDNPALEVLDLSENSITPEGAHLIAEALRGNTTLRKLRLYDYDLFDREKMAIKESLKNNPHVDFEGGHPKGLHEPLYRKGQEF